MAEMLMPDFKKRIALKKWFYSKDFLDKYCYAGQDLGAVWQKEGTLFKVWTPTAEAVCVKIYLFGSKEENQQGEEETEIFFMEQGECGTWSVLIDGDLEGRYYTYLVTVNGETYETSDPYARACGVNGIRSCLLYTSPSPRD